MTVLARGPQGNTVIDYRETGKQMMRNSGVNPDKPLNLRFDNVEDRRDNRDPEIVGMEILAKANGHGKS